MTKETCGQLLLVFGGIALVVYLLAMARYLLPALLYGSRPAAGREARQALVVEVRASGASLAARSCAGRLGNLAVSGPFISVEVHPAGIIVSPLFGSSAVKSDQIKELKYQEGIQAHFEGGVWGRGLWIKHTSPALANPISLHGITSDSEFAQALQSLAANQQPTPHSPK